MRNNWLVLFFMFALVTSGWAQGSEWMMKVNIRYSHAGCFSERIDVISGSFNGQNLGLIDGDVIGPLGNEYRFVLKGTNWAGITNKTMTMAVKGTCSNVFLPAQDLSRFT